MREQGGETGGEKRERERRPAALEMLQFIICSACSAGFVEFFGDLCRCLNTCVGKKRTL